jgi:hypothetical protein
MTDSAENALRNSLDAVDRGRRWAILGVVALFLSMAISVASIFQMAAAARDSGSDPRLLKAMWVATATDMLFIACCTVVVMFHVSRTAKALFRAIELRDR